MLVRCLPSIGLKSTFAQSRIGLAGGCFGRKLFVMADATQSNLPIEERFAQLEKQFTELRAEVLGLRPQAKDWRRTVGMMPDDEISRSAAQLGREWRQCGDEK
jgi:hypothetical protein